MVTDWIAALSGSGQLASNDLRTTSCKIGHHRFPELPDYVTAPAIDYHYISLMLSGPVQVEAILSGRSVSAKVKQGQMFLMAAGEKNIWRWDNPTEEAHVFIEPRIIDQVSRERGLGPVEIQSRFAVSDESVGSIIQFMRRGLSYEGPGAKLMFECGVEFLVHQLITNHCTVVHQEETKYKLSKKQMRQLEAFADENLSNNPDLLELASQVCMSQFHFARLFKNTVGRPPHAWLMEKRMVRAKELIETTQLPILAVAHEVGFQSQSHFGQMFKKWFNVAPAMLRHRHCN